MKYKLRCNCLWLINNNNFNNTNKFKKIKFKNDKNQCSSMKLPKLEIPRFSVNIMKWSEFWESCEATIDRNGSLSDIEKSNYLNSKLWLASQKELFQKLYCLTTKYYYITERKIWRCTNCCEIALCRALEIQ